MQSRPNDPHPRGRFASPVSRREFLRRALLAGLVVPPSLAAVSGCASSSVVGPGAPPSPGATASAGGGLTIATRANPVRWPVDPDNPPIADGLEPEQGGVLQLYNYADYLAPSLIKAFKAKYADYDIDVQLSTFNDVQEALLKIKQGDVPYDIYFPGYDQLGRLVVGKLGRPLNHSYLPNIDHIWPFYQDPWYDQGWQYSVPYTTYTVGMAWNSDVIADDIGALSNPYSSLWDPKYTGKTAVIDDYGTTMAMVILEMGGTDLRPVDPAVLQKVSERLNELTQATSPKVTISQYTEIPSGQIGLSLAWNGDLINAQYYLPKGKSPDVLNYWFPADGKGMADNDLMVLLSGGKCPVLAHLFVDFMLDPKNAIKNFGYTGYQPPQNTLDPAKAVDEGLIAPNLKSATVLREYLEVGYNLTEQPPWMEAEWTKVWQQFKAGA
jgi:spermidine/putrescine transport system substrate-binding protein